MDFDGIKEPIKLGFTPVFIGGSGRSGTSLLYTTTCTDHDDNNTNEVISECFYLTDLIDAYYTGVKSYETDKSLFKEPYDFLVYHSNIVRRVLVDTWKAVGEPKKLVQKNPALTIHFPVVCHLIPEARFLLSIRNPLDILASRKKIILQGKDGEEYSLEYFKSRCQEVKHIYQVALEDIDFYQGKLLPIRYEDFVAGKLDEEINKFLGIQIKQENLWKSSRYQSTDGWMTDKFNKPRQDSSIGNYKEVLNDEEIELVCEICADLMNQFNYENPCVK